MSHALLQSFEFAQKKSIELLKSILSQLKEGLQPSDIHSIIGSSAMNIGSSGWLRPPLVRLFPKDARETSDLLFYIAEFKLSDNIPFAALANKSWRRKEGTIATNLPTRPRRPEVVASYLEHLRPDPWYLGPAFQISCAFASIRPLRRRAGMPE